MNRNLKSVLYVDDEQDILDVMKMCLEEIGNLVVHTVTDGKSIVSLVEKTKPDLILLDVMMPEVDGPATLIELRKNKQFDHIPVVFVTAKVQPDDIKIYTEMGAVAVVVKPFDPMEISAQVNAIWDQAVSAGDSSDNINEIMRPLIHRFKHDLVDREAKLSEYSETISNRELTEIEINELSSIAHKLAGSGTTFGFPHISQAGKELETCLQKEQKPEIVKLAIFNVIQAVNNSI